MKKIFFFLVILVTFSISGCGNNNDSELTQQQKDIYQLAVKVGYEGTFEEWLDSIQGEQGNPGENGKSVELIVEEGFIKWRNIGDTNWYQLVSLNSLIGSNGTNGKEVTFRVFEGYIQWQYIDDLSWNNLVALSILTGSDGVDGANGTNGKEVIFQVANGFIQWKYVGDTTWTNIIELTTLTGVQGIGIASTSINEVGELIITYTDNSVVNIGTIYKVFTVNFVGIDGYLIDSQTVIYGNDAIEPNAPLVIGYTFEGWSEPFTDVTANITVNAVYQKNTYSITFETDGEIGIDSISNIEFGLCIDLPIPVKEGYRFIGWFTGTTANDTHFTNISKVTSNITLYSRWESDVFTVKFIDIDGIVLREVIVSSGDSTTAPVAPEIIGYSFIGWTVPFINVTKNIITKATYKVNQYTITFENNGGSLIDAITQNFGTTIVKPFDPTKSGYSFEGWYSDVILETPYSFTTMPSMNISLYAKWNLIDYTIEYHLDGGINNIDNPSSYNTTNTISFSNPTKTGYTFDGWFGNETFTGNSITRIEIGSIENLSLYAKWSINAYSINYYMVDGYNFLNGIELQFGEIIISVSLGGVHSSALTSSGRLFMWGDNEDGQLGNGTTIYSFTPIDITNKFMLNSGEKIISVELGSGYSSALTTLGRLFMWGYNGSGQLGNGTTTTSLSPIDITNQFTLFNGEKIVSVSLGSSHSSALTSLGRLFMWGSNSVGKLGNGTTTNSFTPIDITSMFMLSSSETIIIVSLGYEHSSALTSSGKLFMWGYNSYGQLGNRTITNSSTPINITNNFTLNSGEKMISVELGSHHSSALSSSGKLFMWGYNDFGQLGNGTIMYNSTPIEINNNFSLSSGEKIVSVSLTFHNSSALTSLGRVFMWGNNYYGQLGNETPTESLFPIDITSNFSLSSGEKIISISLGYVFSSILTSLGRVFMWGNNYYGQLGNGTNTNILTPILIQTFRLIKDSEVIQTYQTSIAPYTPIKDGLTFSGWFTNQDMIIPYTFGTMPGNTLNLYGYWIPNS